MKHGTRIKKKCVYCQKIFYVIPCKNHIKYCSHKCFIKSGSFIHKNKHSEESKNKNKKSHLGKENPKMVGHKFWGGENAKKNWFKKGQKPKNWKGGSASERNRIHNTSWYKNWRNIIFKKFKYRCKECGNGGELHIHHIKSWADHPELRFDINNVVVLCIKCHCKKHKQLRNFIKNYNKKS